MINPYKPFWFDQELTNFRGTRDGKPVLRVVFAPEHFNHLGQRMYPNVLDCWVLERYAPEAASMGLSREEWNERRFFFDDVHGEWVDRLGQYPRNDGYIMIQPLSNAEGKYVPLTSAVLEYIRWRTYQDEAYAALTQHEQENRITEDHQKGESKREQEAENRQEEIDDYYKTNWGRINRKQNAGYSTTPR